MPREKTRVKIRGSERELIPGSLEAGSVDPNERIEVTIVLRPPVEAPALSPEEAGLVSPRKRSFLTHEEYERKHGAAREDLQKIRDFAEDHDLKVTEESPARRSVVLSGTVRQMSVAFGVELKRYEHPKSGIYRGRTGPIFLPASLSSIVQAVLGLDDRPQARTHFRPLAQTALATYTPPQVAKLYAYPPTLDGSGQCIGIIELGGGAATSDLQAYFSRLGIRMPTIVTTSVDGGQNLPTGDPNGPDGEVMLDIEVAGSIANAAKIALYFAPNTDRGFLDAVTTAIHDSQNKPSVVSISWGGPENSWTSQSVQSFNQAFMAAAALGVTVCVASGDGGSSDGENDGLAHVDFPSSSPFSLGCGGTRLLSASGMITEEVVWNDGSAGGATGGGVSSLFPLPSWQDSSNVPRSANPGGQVGRGVPDVCGDADPVTGYEVRVDGQAATFGGTSAVAPLWSALIALVSQQLGHPIGYLNPLLYGKSANGTLHDITSGNNGAYSAAPGWDACTGLGSPDGQRILAMLAQG